MNRYPDAEIVFMTPLHRRTESVPKADSGKVLADYVRAIKEITEFYGIPTLDLYATSGIQPAVVGAPDTMTIDGLHPNDKGAERIADRLLGFLLSL